MERGLQDLRRAVRDLGTIAERDPAIQAAMGHAWLARENQRKALPHLEAAVRLDPGRAPAWADLGLARIMTGEPELAREALDRALRHDPGLATAWYNRGLLNLHAERLGEAEADLARAAVLAPDNPDIVQLLQQVRQMRRQADQDS